MKVARVVLSLAALLALVFAVQAQEKADKKAKKQAGTQGLVEGVDAKNKTITFKTGNKKENNIQSVTVGLTDQTQITVRDEANPKGRGGKLDDVASGKRILIQLEEKDGKKLATSVTVMGGAKKKKDGK